MKKLIFLGHIPLTENYKRYLGMDLMSARGLEFEYWDITAIYVEDFQMPGEISAPCVRKFTSLEDLETYLVPRAGEVFVLTVVAFEPRLLSLMRMLTRHNVEIGHMAVGLSPQPSGGFISRIWGKLHYLVSWAELSSFLAYKACAVLKRLGYIKKYDVVFAAGAAACGLNAGNAAAVVKINHYDYDSSLAHSGEEERLVDGKYCVFLDENLAGHPDLKMLGLDLIDPVKYYKELNDFFERLEAASGSRVVIAAHPKSEYAENTFNGRKTFRYLTRRLVRYCDFAFSVGSNSSGFAAIYNKPLFFIYTSEILKKYMSIKYNLYPFLCADAFGTQAYDIERSDVTPVIPRVDASRYLAYKYRYLTSPECEARLNVDIIQEFLSRGAIK
ncbi:MAG: hypothetical protein A2270_04620 [Elusimicrobia bacterium RIFOXYA12_FULL_51_18]|nr:MAG: hypothetical protein A2270_04620 [Elusimicrobia bacterium RIFOXYA12_FULL_51_18]OGS32861.1 MAG: hypothetical protein A2218_10675 [Elusimicrobia bacterium RIFOXYA2_FULL_53_38]